MPCSSLTFVAIVSLYIILRFADIPAVTYQITLCIKREVLRVPYQAHTVDIQRGFVPARQFLQNVVDWDCQARADGMLGQTLLVPLMMFWDIAATFPSVCHDWIWTVLEAMPIRGL